VTPPDTEPVQLWTCIARCRRCGAELNRAEHVPPRDRPRVALGAPFVALCEIREHNTFSDLNWAFDLEWIAEPPAAQ
jgi:hypothetical protein